MNLRLVSTFAFAFECSIGYPLGFSGKVSAQSLTETVGSASGSIVSTVSVPGCSSYGGSSPPLSDPKNMSGSNSTIVELGVIQSVTNIPNCSDAAVTNLTVAGDNVGVGKVSSNVAVVAASATNEGTIDLSLSSNASETSTVNLPSGGLTQGEVIVFHGSVRVSRSVTGGLLVSTSATGPGVDLSVDDMSGLSGTVVDVLSGTTTTYDVSGGSSMTADFSVVVIGSIELEAGSSAGTSTTLTDESAQAEADAFISGSLTVHDSSSFPTMNSVTVTQ